MNSMRMIDSLQIRVVTILSCVFIFLGCGDQKQVVVTQPQVAPAPPATRAGSSTVSQNDAPSDFQSITESPKPVAKPKLIVERSDNPLEWSKQEIAYAIEERDLDVVLALQNYADQHIGSHWSAFDVIAWIKILEETPKKVVSENDRPEEFESSATGSGRYVVPGLTVDEQIAEALIETLVTLQTLTGYQAAREILDGQLVVSIDEERVVRFVLTSLARNVEGSSSPGGKMLFQCLQNPQLIKPSGAGVNAARMQQIAFEEHWKNSIGVIDGLMGLSPLEVGYMIPRSSAAQGSADAFEETSAQVRPDGKLINGGKAGKQELRKHILAHRRLPNY